MTLLQVTSVIYYFCSNFLVKKDLKLNLNHDKSVKTMLLLYYSDEMVDETSLEKSFKHLLKLFVTSFIPVILYRCRLRKIKKIRKKDLLLLVVL